MNRFEIGSGEGADGGGGGAVRVDDLEDFGAGVAGGLAEATAVTVAGTLAGALARLAVFSPGVDAGAFAVFAAVLLAASALAGGLLTGTSSLLVLA